MALHTSLPIYRVTHEFLGVVTDITRNMPRDYKASIGSKLREEGIELIVLVYRANAARAKAPHLSDLIERLQVIELLLRLSKDKRFISVGQYARSIELTAQIGRQANAWRKHSTSSPVV